MMAVDKLVAKLRELVADPSREDDIEHAKLVLLEMMKGPEGGRVRELVEGLLRGEVLEVRWELEEVLEAAAPPPPPPPPEPEPEPEPEEAAGDDELVVVYDDPRGLVLHRTRSGDRWFATQVDPQTGQPATFELPAHQIDAVKQQLAGSPYWVLGAGA